MSTTHHAPNTSPAELLRKKTARRLAYARRRKHLTLLALAKLTNGRISKSRISNYEQGIRTMPTHVACILAEALGDVSAAYLLGLMETPSLNSDAELLLDAYQKSGTEGRRRLLETASKVLAESDRAAA